MAAYYNEIDKFAAAWLRELIKDKLIADGEVDERDIRDVQPEDVHGFTQCHFFAGIGGWPLALQLAGIFPDIILLQEVVSDPDEDYPSTRQTVLDNLGAGYSAVFGNFLGEAIDTPGLGQMTITRLRVVSSENRTVSAIRSVHYVALEVEPGVMVHVYNAHLEGTGAVLETVQPGETFGELTLIDGVPRGATAIAREPTEVAVIDERAFHYLVARDPAFALDLLRRLSRRLRRMNESQ